MNDWYFESVMAYKDFLERLEKREEEENKKVGIRLSTAIKNVLGADVNCETKTCTLEHEEDRYVFQLRVIGLREVLVLVETCPRCRREIPIEILNKRDMGFNINIRQTRKRLCAKCLERIDRQSEAEIYE